MTISIGEKLPDATFQVMGEDGPEPLESGAFFAGRKIVLFAVPGAFTPTCHRNHLPGFLEHLDAILAKGVDEVAVIGVNDVFVMNAWAKDTGGKGKIAFLADGGAKFTQAIGMGIDLTEAGLGMRSKRYSMIVEDGVVKAFNIEEAPGQAVASGAAAILEQL